MEVIIDDDKYKYKIKYHGGRVVYDATWYHPAEWEELEIDEVVFISGDSEAFKKLDYDVFYHELEEAIQ